MRCERQSSATMRTEWEPRNSTRPTINSVMVVSNAGRAGKVRSIANLVVSDAIHGNRQPGTLNSLPAGAISGIVHRTIRFKESPMPPAPHPGTGEVGVPAGNVPAVYFPEAAQSLALTQRFAALSAGAGYAFCALTAN